MKIIKINGIEVQCCLAKPYKSVILMSESYDTLSKKYEFNSLKVVVSEQDDFKKVLKLIQEHNTYLIEFDVISEEFYIVKPNYEDMQRYIEAGFLDLDFMPTSPKLMEIT
jgi:hypothetical protein